MNFNLKNLLIDLFTFKHVPVFYWTQREQYLTEFIFECYHNNINYVDINRWIDENIVLIDFYFDDRISKEQREIELKKLNTSILTLKGFLKEDVNKLLKSGLFIATHSGNGTSIDFNLFSLSKEFSKELIPFNGDYMKYKEAEYLNLSNKEKDRIFENYSKLVSSSTALFALIISLFAFFDNSEEKKLNKRIDELQQQLVVLQSNKQTIVQNPDTVKVVVLPLKKDSL